MNDTQTKMKVFEIVDGHLNSKCEICVGLLAKILYHAQSDENVKDNIDYLVESSPDSDKLSKESELDFIKNEQEMLKEAKKYQEKINGKKN